MRAHVAVAIEALKEALPTQPLVLDHSHEQLIVALLDLCAAHVSCGQRRFRERRAEARAHAHVPQGAAARQAVGDTVERRGARAAGASAVRIYTPTLGTTLLAASALG